MVHYSKNKGELLVLAGAIYSFLAYLTAFTLEILFIIDLARTSSNLIAETINSPTSTTVSQSAAEQTANTGYNQNHHQNHHLLYPQSATTTTTTVTNSFDQARLALETMQTHITISCLAISILYFIIFVASLILIIAIILRSTFFLLIWMCTMCTMYLPEFALITYVSVYGWGLESRNGQTELLFYLIRAILNVTFIYRAYRLYKDWQYEKNFFMLKSSSLGSASSHSRYNSASYDSPYFIGDSLTTTINPVFSCSTLNLDRYDAIRDFNISPTSTVNNNNNNNTDDNNNNNNHNPQNQNYFEDFNTQKGRSRKVVSMYSPATRQYQANQNFPLDCDNRPIGFGSSAFYANELNRAVKTHENNNNQQQQQQVIGNRTNNNKNHRTSLYQIRPNSVLSINDNDDFADYEMDLDYRTLTQQRHYQKQQNENNQRQYYNNNQHQATHGRRRPIELSSNLNNNNRNSNGISYSTQSLDRRHLNDMDFALPEQVILRPLGHQPFDYLTRPGSITNLNTLNNINTQPQAFQNLSSMNTTSNQAAKRYDYNLHDRFS